MIDTEKRQLVFPLYPELVLDVGMRKCTKPSDGTIGEYSYCGYKENGLQEEIFDALCEINDDDDE
jgi:hypothetical protein